MRPAVLKITAFHERKRNVGRAKRCEVLCCGCKLHVEAILVLICVEIGKQERHVAELRVCIVEVEISAPQKL